jgi:hypothetical protein
MIKLKQMKWNGPYTKLFAIGAVCVSFAACDDFKSERLCDPVTSSPNGVSFVFSVQDNGLAMQSIDPKMIELDDGGVVSGLESSAAAISRPVALAMRTVILVDGSGSLYDSQRITENKMKKSIEAFINAAPNQNIIGVYKFYGANEIVPIYPFTDARDRALSLSTYASTSHTVQQSVSHMGGLYHTTASSVETTQMGAQYQIEHQAEAANADRAAMLAAISNDKITRKDASTALFSAVHQALGLADQQNPNQTSSTQLTIRSLILFTDGQDESLAGRSYQAGMQEILNESNQFKSGRDSMIMVAGVSHVGNPLPRDFANFMQTVATDGGFLQGSIDEMPGIFNTFAKRMILSGKKYFQFNLCSARREGLINAELRVKGTSIPPISFQYDASQLRDPGEGEFCDPSTTDFATCSF